MLKIFGSILKIRILVICFVTAMFFFSMTAFSVPTSKFLAGDGVVKAYNRIAETYYFTDNTYTVQCGSRFENCRGQVTIYGTVTSYELTIIREC